MLAAVNQTTVDGFTILSNFFGIDLRPSKPEAENTEDEETQTEGQQTDQNASTESARQFPTDVRLNTKN